MVARTGVAPANLCGNSVHIQSSFCFIERRNFRFRTCLDSTDTLHNLVLLIGVAIALLGVPVVARKARRMNFRQAKQQKRFANAVNIGNLCRFDRTQWRGLIFCSDYVEIGE